MCLKFQFEAMQPEYSSFSQQMLHCNPISPYTIQREK